MNNLFKKALGLVTGEVVAAPVLTMPKDRQFKKRTERELLQMESKIGAQLFGPLTPGRRREFFCLDEKTWIWHEEGIDAGAGVSEPVTIRYEIQEKGILKVLPGARYAYIEGAELDNLVAATQVYYERVAREIYNRNPQTGDTFAL